MQSVAVWVLLYKNIFGLDMLGIRKDVFSERAVRC